MESLYPTTRHGDSTTKRPGKIVPIPQHSTPLHHRPTTAHATIASSKRHSSNEAVYQPTTLRHLHTIRDTRRMRPLPHESYHATTAHKPLAIRIPRPANISLPENLPPHSRTRRNTMATNATATTTRQNPSQNRHTIPPLRHKQPGWILHSG